VSCSFMIYAAARPSALTSACPSALDRSVERPFPATLSHLRAVRSFPVKVVPHIGAPGPHPTNKNMDQGLIAGRNQATGPALILIPWSSAKHTNRPRTPDDHISPRVISAGVLPGGQVGPLTGLRRQRPLPHNDYLSIRGRSAIVRDGSMIMVGRTVTTKLAG
jgi:hypothetical protein